MDIFGYSSNEILNMKFYDLFIEKSNDEKTIKVHLLNLLPKQSFNSKQFQIKCNDGTYKWMKLSINIIPNNIIDGCIYIAVFVDISEEKIFEEELHQYKEKYHRIKTQMDNIFDNIPALIFYKDKENKFIKVNKMLADAYGMNRDDLKVKNCLDIYSKNISKNYWLDDLEVFKNKEAKLNIEEQWETNKGIKWLQTSKIPYFDNVGNIIGIVGFSIDITKFKKIENKLKVSEEKYRKFIENIKEGYYEVDIRGRFLNVNNALCEILEYPINEIYHLRMREIYDEETKTFIFNSFNDLFENEKEGISIQYEFKKKDGGRIYLETSAYLRYNSNGYKDGFYGLVRDITQRKGMEELVEELQKSEEKYRKIIENIKEGYYEVDIGGHYTFINPAFCKMVESSTEDLLGSSYKKIMNEINIKKVFKGFNEVFTTGQPKYDFEFSYINMSGKEVIVESSVDIKYDNEGNKIGFYGLIRDITQRKAMDDLIEEVNELLEEEVQERTKELNALLMEQKNYMDEILKASQFKSNFLATMSHELRTPLNAIIGFTDLLLEDFLGPISEVQKEYINDIKSSAEHQFDMIQNILDISKIEAGQITLDLKDFSLNAIINQVIASFKLQIENKNLEIIKEGLDSEKIIHADVVKLKQILINLISNAVKYTIKGKIILSLQETEKEWIFKIKDTGIGIAEKDFSLIFEDFKRVNSSYVNSIPGTGLGLSLIKRIINLHGGDIWFESQLNKGTTFIFSIPKIIL